MVLLSPCDYGLVKSALGDVDANVMFAHAVVNRDVKGTIYVDDPKVPTIFYVAHPYGMSLLFGNNVYHEDFNHALKQYLFKQRYASEWLQVYPLAWEKLIETLNAETKAMQRFERLNFQFSKERYLALKKTINLEDVRVMRVDETLYQKISGKVVPKRFWNNYYDFELYGMGYSVVDEKKTPLCTAFSSFIVNDRLELGIETQEAHQGKGYAYAACCALIDACLQKGLEPVWSCGSYNDASQKLAEKLGFVPTLKRAYYHLAPHA